MKGIQRLIQWLIYRRLDPNELSPSHARRIQYIYTVLLLMLVVSIPFLIRAIQWNIPIRIFGVGSAFLIAVTLITINPYRRKLLLNGYIAVFALVVAVVPAILSNGGFSGAAIGWLTILPLLGGFLIGPRSAIIWTAISITILFSFYIAESQGIVFPNLTPAEFIQSQKLLQYIGIIIALFFIVSSFLSSLLASESHFKELIVELESEIKQRKLAEHNAKKASKAKSDFLSNISHELRTPMNAIMGMAQLTLDSNLNIEQQHQIKVIDTSSKFLLDIINDILDFSKIEANKLQLDISPFPFNEMLANLEAMFSFEAQKKQLVLHFDIDPKIPPVLVADELRLNQILSNLISNAIKFTNSGDVVVSAKAEQDTMDKFNILFSVRDTGIGIPTQSINSLFDPFTQADSSITRKFGGTGLGLTITKRLIDLMEGSINVLSKEGQGSEFQVRIQVKTQLNSSQPTINASKNKMELNKLNPSPLKGRYLLVVEDNIVNQEVAKKILQKLGAHVVIADNGLDALERLNSQEFDAILMDLQMPVMDGLQATKAIRKQDKFSQLPILAMSAHVKQSDIDECIEAGMNDYIPKPYRKEQLLDTLNTWLS